MEPATARRPAGEVAANCAGRTVALAHGRAECTGWSAPPEERVRRSREAGGSDGARTGRSGGRVAGEIAGRLLGISPQLAVLEERPSGGRNRCAAGRRDLGGVAGLAQAVDGRGQAIRDLPPGLASTRDLRRNIGPGRRHSCQPAGSNRTGLSPRHRRHPNHHRCRHPNHRRRHPDHRRRIIIPIVDVIVGECRGALQRRGPVRAGGYGHGRQRPLERGPARTQPPVRRGWTGECRPCRSSPLFPSTGQRRSIPERGPLAFRRHREVWNRPTAWRRGGRSVRRRNSRGTNRQRRARPAGPGSRGGSRRRRRAPTRRRRYRARRLAGGAGIP